MTVFAEKSYGGSRVNETACREGGKLGFHLLLFREQGLILEELMQGMIKERLQKRR